MKLSSSGAAVTVLLLGAGLVLSGCASSVGLDAAADSNNPGCAEIQVRLPDRLGDDLGRRETGAQSTAAWGNPAAVLLRCGVPVPGPTTDACISVNDIDWIQEPGIKDNQYKFITYGRDPATEVIIDTNYITGATALTDLTGSIAALSPYTHCTALSDTK